jgi:hypothetical protein
MSHWKLVEAEFVRGGAAPESTNQAAAREVDNRDQPQSSEWQRHRTGDWSRGPSRHSADGQGRGRGRGGQHHNGGFDRSRRGGRGGRRGRGPRYGGVYVPDTPETRQYLISQAHQLM